MLSSQLTRAHAEASYFVIRGKLSVMLFRRTGFRSVLLHSGELSTLFDAQLHVWRKRVDVSEKRGGCYSCRVCVLAEVMIEGCTMADVACFWVWGIVFEQILLAELRKELVCAIRFPLAESYMRHVHFQRPPWAELDEFARLKLLNENN